MAPSDDDLKNAMEKYTAWIDDQIANVDISCESACNNDPPLA